ncbi:MAG: CPBP family intramembrane metalloprotease [Ruminococcus sp.]|nr:CPBP family intramembrane metalloprotease [Ruminococcus sp.]
MEKRKNIIGLIIGVLGSMLALYGVISFNKFVLMSLPLAVRMIMSIIVYWLIAVIPIVVMLINKDKLSDYGFSKEKLFIQIITGIILGFTMSFILTLIPHLVGFGEYVSNGKQYKYLWQFVYEFIFCILAVGCVEEYVFRGFMYSKAKSIFRRDIMSIIVSSVLFGFFHLFSGNIVQMIMTTLIGATLCIFRNKIKDCSTLSLIIAHGIYDALITVWGYVFL